MKKYLSFGAGVCSTALMLLLLDEGEKFEVVFSNHGGDYPETYLYVDYLREKGYPITEIIPLVQGSHTLYDHCIEKGIAPAIKWRWCTHKFKIRPLLKYFEKPCIQYIGFTYDERHRTENNQVPKGITNRFPLIEMKLVRKDCIDVIKEHGLFVPRKSGCWFCPFQKKGELRLLKRKHPELYEKFKILEKNAKKKGFTPYIKGPLNMMVAEKTVKLETFL